MTEGKVKAARKLLSSGTPPRDVAQSLGVSVPTLYRWVPASTRMEVLYGVRTRNGNLSTVRSFLLVDWSANPLSRNAQPPSQSSWSSSTRFAVKRAEIEFWSVFF